MRRSAHVFAPILAATALGLSGCHHNDPQRCVDEQNHVVDAKFCASLPANAQQPVSGTLGNGGGYYGGGGIFYPHMYRYYYGGLGGALGSSVTGGSYAPIAGRSYSTGAGRGAASASGTSRGGFGSSFSGGGE